MSRYRLAVEALNDLREIWDYIHQDSPRSADRVIAEFRRAFEMLSRRPEIGHRREDLTARDVRFWPIRSYLIVYQPGARPLDILAVLHGKRHLKDILSEH